MGLLARLLLGRPRRVEEIPDLSVDLETLSLAGLSRGSDRTAVTKRLGPPAGFWESRRGSLRYPCLGLHVRLNEQGRLASYAVSANPDPQTQDGIAPFRGAWLPGGSPEPPDEAGLIQILGEPDQRLIEEDEDSLEWNAPEGLVGADFTVDGQLTEIYVDYDAEPVPSDSSGSWEPAAEATVDSGVRPAPEPEATLADAAPQVAEDADFGLPVGVEETPFEQEIPEKGDGSGADAPSESTPSETVEAEKPGEPQEPPGQAAPPEKEDREVHPPVEVGAIEAVSSSSKGEEELAAVGAPTPPGPETVNVDPHPELHLQQTGEPQERREDATASPSSKDDGEPAAIGASKPARREDPAAQVAEDRDAESPPEVDAVQVGQSSHKDEEDPAVVASLETAHSEAAAAALEPQGQPGGQAR